MNNGCPKCEENKGTEILQKLIDILDESIADSMKMLEKVKAKKAEMKKNGL